MSASWWWMSSAGSIRRLKANWICWFGWMPTSGTATQPGTERDRSLGRNQYRPWDEVWMPNDRDFEARFRPQRAADRVYGRDADAIR